MSWKWAADVQAVQAFSRLPQLLSSDPATQDLLRRFLQSVAFKGDLQYLKLTDVEEGSFAGKTPGAFVGLNDDGDQLTLINAEDQDRTFLALTDTPPSYAGETGKVVSVNAAEDGLEFTTPVTTFLGLTDTPSSYSGSGGYTVKVNAGADALEFVSVASGSNTHPYCRIYHNATQTFSSSSSAQQIQFNTDDIDPNNWSDLANYEIDCPGTNLYMAQLTIEGNTSSEPSYPCRMFLMPEIKWATAEGTYGSFSSFISDCVRFEANADWANFEYHISVSSPILKPNSSNSLTFEGWFTYIDSGGGVNFVLNEMVLTVWQMGTDS